ncbi:hypothetical protein CRV08_04595 [Halarcobacter ebronensis]|uniref:Uncharacterized protein n=1 Tax=Halarcobacter ebronensis TaxID=1462615 RepID=A0A4Q0YFH8_9BACT|nr:hypothetical protein [Halarcobacter ebronensis]RXJ69292.1 hypothetical protein CRV08_04595 [Halarcobacter ebronensis]
MNRFSVLKIVVFFVVSILSLKADVAYQQGWNRQPLLENNIRNKVELEEFLSQVDCKVANYSRNRGLSTVVSRGLHVTDEFPHPHYTVRLFNCPTSTLTYEGNMLGCGKENWAGTYHVFENGSCE